MAGQSFKTFMDELEKAQQTVAPGDGTWEGGGLACFRWKPTSPDPDCLYNVLSRSPHMWMDSQRERDEVRLATLIVVRDTPGTAYMERLEHYIDSFRTVMTDRFRRGQPLNGAAKWADRLAFEPVTEQVGDTTFPAVRFELTASLDRMTSH